LRLPQFGGRIFFDRQIKKDSFVVASELKPGVQNALTKPTPAQWPWYLCVIAVVGAVEPLVGYVRHGSEPYVGHWVASALGILAAAGAGLPIFALVTWVIRHEQTKQSNGIAAMIYRPAALPSLGFLGALLKNLPSVFTEIFPYGFLGVFVLLLAITVIMQQRSGKAWSWSFAILIGFGITLLAMLAAGILSLTFGQRP
jgi:hypothetical protein